MELVIVIIFIGIIFFTDFWPAIKGKDKKEIWIYGVTFAIGFGVLTLGGLHVRLPVFPTDLIANAVKWVIGG